jgi:hypothetical protein
MSKNTPEILRPKPEAIRNIWAKARRSLIKGFSLIISYYHRLKPMDTIVHTVHAGLYTLYTPGRTCRTCRGIHTVHAGAYTSLIAGKHIIKNVCTRFFQCNTVRELRNET